MYATGEKGQSLLTRRDFRWIAIGLIAFCLYDYWDISQHKVPQNTVTFAPDPRFRGVLNLFVESGPPLMKFQIDLDAGQGVSRPNNGENPDPALPVQCGRDPHGDRRDLPSPNGAFFISCELTDAITVKQADGSLLNSHVFAPGSGIDSEAWAPDSSAIVVLTRRTRTDFYSPRGFLRLFSGHPIELSTYRVFLFSPENDHVKEIPVLTRSLEGAWAAVGWVK
jgi:hypothetical protein